MSDDRTGTLELDEDPPLTEEQLASLDASPLGPALGPALLAVVDDVKRLDVSGPQASLDEAWARLDARLEHEPPRAAPVSDHPFASNETSGTRIRKAADVRPIGAGKSNRTMVYGAAVLAAAAAFAVWVNNKRVAPPVAPVAAKSYPPIVEIGDGGATRPLALGEVVTVPLEKTRWIAANGRLRVRIGGGSSVRLLENGERVLLALDHGTIGADVTPVPGGEPLAIDLGRHRIAVHGTKFQVQRAEEAVDIAVTEGVVVWGWPKGTRTEGVEVKAGQIANFVWDTGGVVNDPLSANGKVSSALRVEAATTGSATAIPLLAPLPHPGASEPTSAPKPVLTAPPLTTSATVAVVPSVSETTTAVPSTTGTVAVVAPPAGLSDTQAAHGLGKLQQGLEACVVGGSIGPKFTIETTMTVVVSKAGVVESWTFDPPLDPSLRECARKKTQGLAFPSADAPSTFKRPVVLGKK